MTRWFRGVAEQIKVEKKFEKLTARQTSFHVPTLSAMAKHRHARRSDGSC